MDKNVIPTEEQIDWVSQLTPTHINLTPEPIFPLEGKPLIIGHTRTGKTRLADLSDVFRPRHLSGSDQENV